MEDIEHIFRITMDNGKEYIVSRKVGFRNRALAISALLTYENVAYDGEGDEGTVYLIKDHISTIADITQFEDDE